MPCTVLGFSFALFTRRSTGCVEGCVDTCGSRPQIQPRPSSLLDASERDRILMRKSELCRSFLARRIRISRFCVWGLLMPTKRSFCFRPLHFLPDYNLNLPFLPKNSRPRATLVATAMRRCQEILSCQPPQGTPPHLKRRDLPPKFENSRARLWPRAEPRFQAFAAIRGAIWQLIKLWCTKVLGRSQLNL